MEQHHGEKLHGPKSEGQDGTQYAKSLSDTNPTASDEWIDSVRSLPDVQAKIQSRQEVVMHKKYWLHIGLKKSQISSLSVSLIPYLLISCLALCPSDELICKDKIWPAVLQKDCVLFSPSLVAKLQIEECKVVLELLEVLLQQSSSGMETANDNSGTELSMISKALIAVSSPHVMEMISKALIVVSSPHVVSAPTTCPEILLASHHPCIARGCHKSVIEVATRV